ncbi:MAG TPA: molybdenum ABC transporter ATP-binding protein [Stellaceae bacterium]
MIEVAVEKRLGDFQLDARFSAPANGIVALYGRSGTGKTTLVNTIAGLVRPDRGRIVIAGETLYSSAEGIDLPPRRRRVGYIFQEGRLFPHVSVRRNLIYGAGNGAGAIQFDQIVALLGIGALLERRPGDLSGGEKQRVAIGRALLSQPRLLLMDEPLAALDGGRKAEILPFIERLHAELKIPTVYVSHDMDENMRLADTLVLMEAGRVAAVGPVEELTSRLDLQPLTGRYDAGAVIRATVAGHDLNFGLSELAFPGGRLRVSHIGLPLGTAVRARIRANDVALANTRPEQISIRNILPARIIELAADRENANVVDVRLRVGTPEKGTMLWSRITLRASRELALGVEKPVFALIKAVALDRSNYIATAQRDANKSL